MRSESVLRVSMLVVSSALVAAACVGAADRPVTEAWSSRIGEDADCDPSEPGCWPEWSRMAVSWTVARLGAAADGPLEGRARALCDVTAGLNGLAAKLPADVGESIAQDAWLVCAAGPVEDGTLVAAAGRLAGPVATLQADLTGAYLGPLAELIATSDDGASDAPCTACAGAWHWPTRGFVPEQWPAPVREVLLDLQDRGGVVGAAYVAIIVATGVFDTDFALANATLFGEIDPGTGQWRDSGLSRDQRIERIVEESIRRARWVGGLTSVMSLFAVPGLVLGGAVREILVTSERLQTAFRLAQAMGFDPLAPTTISACLSIVIGGGALPFAVEEMAVGAGWLLRNKLIDHLANRWAAAAFARGGMSAYQVALTLARTLAVAIAGVIGAITEDLLARQFCSNAVEALEQLAAQMPPPG